MFFALFPDEFSGTELRKRPRKEAARIRAAGEDASKAVLEDAETKAQRGDYAGAEAALDRLAPFGLVAVENSVKVKRSEIAAAREEDEKAPRRPPAPSRPPPGRRRSPTASLSRCSRRPRGRTARGGPGRPPRRRNRRAGPSSRRPRGRPSRHPRPPRGSAPPPSPRARPLGSGELIGERREERRRRAVLLLLHEGHGLHDAIVKGALRVLRELLPRGVPRRGQRADAVLRVGAYLDEGPGHHDLIAIAHGIERRVGVLLLVLPAAARSSDAFSSADGATGGPDCRSPRRWASRAPSGRRASGRRRRRRPRPGRRPRSPRR